MKDNFEEHLKARLEALESDPEIAGMLHADVVWNKIQQAQHQPGKKRIWLSYCYKVAAVLMIFSGILFLWPSQQERIDQAVSAIPGRTHRSVPADTQFAGPAVQLPAVAGSGPHSGSVVLPDRRATSVPKRVGHSAAQHRNEVRASGDDSIALPSLTHEKSFVQEEIPIVQASPKVVYLSDLDLDKEGPQATSPRKPLASRKGFNYIKSNQGDYACIPPIVFINQILYKQQ